MTEKSRKIKSSKGYQIAKFAAGEIGDFGAGAIAGALFALAPVGKVKGGAKIAAVLGLIGIAKWYGNEASVAIKDAMDEVVDAACIVQQWLTAKNEDEYDDDEEELEYE